MKNLKRAAKKRESRKFKKGDWVTWGNGSRCHQVVDVSERGVTVDVTGENDAHYWAQAQPDGRFFLVVLFDHNMQGPGPRCRFRENGVCSGPPRKVDPIVEAAKAAKRKLQYDQ